MVSQYDHVSKVANKTLHQPLLVASVPPNMPDSTDMPIVTLVQVVNSTHMIQATNPDHLLTLRILPSVFMEIK